MKKWLLFLLLLPQTLLFGLIFLMCATGFQEGEHPAAIFFAGALFVLLLALTVRESRRARGKSLAPGAKRKPDEAENLLGEFLFTDSARLQAELQSFALKKKLNPQELKARIDAALPGALQRLLPDVLMTPDQQRKLDAFLQMNGISRDDLSPASRNQVLKGILLHDLVEGNANPWLRQTPFKLSREEIPIWSEDAPLFELREFTWMGGDSQSRARFSPEAGRTLRPGEIYLRQHTGTELTPLGAGQVSLTSRNLYWQAGTVSRRIGLDSVFRVDFSDKGLLVQMDSPDARPLVIGTNDQWFLANAIHLAGNWAEA